MFDAFLFELRKQGLSIGMSEWLVFLRGLGKGLAGDVDTLYHFGRSVLVHSEADYDKYDLGFHAAFGAIVEGSEEVARIAAALEAWLKDPARFDEARAAGQHDFASVEELMEAFRRTLEEQTGRHEGGNRWIGTGGTSPYGNGGRANMGVRVGGTPGGGGRSAARMAEERLWRNYRTDAPLDVRDFKVALRALRNLAREGVEVLDIDDSIAETARNAGEIELVFRPDKKNRVRVVLMMDAGGSMDPHTELVSRLFTAAKSTHTFKTFDAYYFHNCVYKHLYVDYDTGERIPTEKVLEGLTPEHRLIFVGDASMATWELMGMNGSFGDKSPTGYEQLVRLARRCPASVWLNPDAPRFWAHPTVSAIGSVVRMFPLSLRGLRDGIAFLRAPR